MAVYEQTYLPWSGISASRLSRVWALVQPGLVHPFRSFWTLIVVILAFVLVGGWLLILFAVASSQMPQVFALGNNIYRQEFYNNGLFSMILAVLSCTVGASLISRDLKHHALLMYFSRAITPLDYVAGKFLTLVLFLLFVTLGPGLLLFLGQWGIGMEKLSTAERLADLGAITLHSLVLVVPMSAAVLACSSLARRPYVAGILWATVFFSSVMISDILVRIIGEEWCGLLSWTNLTAHLGNSCYAVREVKAAVPYKPPDPVLECGWAPPLLILAGITVLSLALVRWRLRTVEAGE
jgi:ABC-type transport system involved in multi-copper enzyme maturation permease subunit